MSRSAGASGLLLCLVGAVVAWAAPEEADAPMGVPSALAPTSNPTTEAKVALGKKLFADRRISVDGSLSCVSCHVASLAFTDGRPAPLGMGGAKLRRNAPTLLNVSLVEDFFHDGRAPSLEEQARQVFLNPLELGWTDAEGPASQIASIPEYPPLFDRAFGSREITLQRILRAIAAFERTLLAGNAPFDHWWRGDKTALTDDQVAGYELFIGDAGCVQCHSIRQSYATFSDGRFHNTGAGADVREGLPADAGKADPGRMAVTGRGEDRGAFRTPTLRNVELTGPFMHDGSLATLAEVVDFYVDGGGANANLSPLVRPLPLDETQRGQLVAFLLALTSPEMPALDECDRLLAEGRPAEALPLFRAEFERDATNDRALSGLARCALALDTRAGLLEVEPLLRHRVHALSPGGADDGAVAPLLTLLGRVCAGLSATEDALAIARAEDALLCWERVLATDVSADLRVETTLLATAWLESMGRRDRAVDVATQGAHAVPDSGALRERLAAAHFRRPWQTLSGAPDDAQRADFEATAEILDGLAAAGHLERSESHLFRAYAHHYVGDVDGARDAYRDAVLADESIAERALTGLRNLLAADLDAYRAGLGTLLIERPASPAVLLFSGWEALQQGDLDTAERHLRKRLEVEEAATPGPHVYLAHVERRRGQRDLATEHYAVALALDPTFPGLVAEFEGYVRSRPLDGFAAVDALVSDYELFLAANADDARFQCLARNNLAFTLREVAASYASRGAARHHAFAEGAPPDAKRILDLCLRTYDDAVARIPADAAELPFADRWVYAGVLNDTALMLHYFDDLRDLERAESLYIRAFELTDGAYQDAYFYNLQFLYAFELDGREERWFELAARAKDRILREDADSPTGFSPDAIKRRAAQRDWERLGAALGR